MGSLQWEIVELASHLRNERLFVASEQENLRTLNKEVASASTRLAENLWILSQQRLNLRRLVSSHPDCPPYICSRRARNLDSTRFIDGHKVLGVQEAIRYGHFLYVLRLSPRLLASCLIAASQPAGGSKSQSSNSSVSSNSSCEGGSTACGVGSVTGASIPLLSPEALSGVYHSLLSGLFCGWDMEDNPEEDGEENSSERAMWRGSVCEDPFPDERGVPVILRLLRHLAKVQVAPSPDPRRLLRQGSCAFARIYSSIREDLLSLRLFLTAALHKPVCHLIATEWKRDPSEEGFEGLEEDGWGVAGLGWESEMYDPGCIEDVGGAGDWKGRGNEETEAGPSDYSCVNDHKRKRKGCSRKAVVRLAALVRRFLRSLRANARHFPAPLRWLIAHVRQEMLLATSASINGDNSGRASPVNGQDGILRGDPLERVGALCTDLAFTLIVCPAIADPEAHGIISPDVPVSQQASHRLLQVAKALQGLALRPYQEEDPRLADLYSLFEKDCVSSIVDCMLEDDDEETEEDGVCGEEDEVEVDIGEGGEGDAMGMNMGGVRVRRGRRRKQRKRRRERLAIPPPIIHSSNTRGLSRSAALFTESELLNLVSFLQTVYTESQSSLIDKKQLGALLNLLPATGIAVNGKHTNNNTLHPQQPVSVSPITASKRALLLGKVGRTRISRTSSLSSSPAGHDGWDDGGGEEDVTPPAGSPSNASLANRPSSPREDVLVIPFGQAGGECIGMLPEEKVLEMEWERRQGRGLAGVRGSVASIGGAAVAVTERELSGKRTRFSLSHDEASIVSTLDAGEVDGVNVGDETRSVEVEEEEAVSNHSVASSLELGTEEEEEEEDEVESGRRRRRGKRRGVGGEVVGGIGGPGEEDQLVLDNLSDMVSANVSSRGTPNISGRDTPSSQITEGDGEEGRVGGSGGAEEEDGSGVGGAVGLPAVRGNVVDGGVDGGVDNMPGEGECLGMDGSRGGSLPHRQRHPISKQQLQQQQQARSDIDDKFGKFEIKKLIEGDETVSLVSDTWSTDVLASDSETVDLNRDSGSGLLNQMNPLPLNPLVPGQQLIPGHQSASSSLISPPNEEGLVVGALGAAGSARQDASSQLLDVSETGSEAWSVDVLASDYERMCEVDTDDAGSVARSDDTARSELEAEGIGVRGELERAPSLGLPGDELGAAGRSEEKATPPLPHGAMGTRGPSPGLSSARGLSPGPTSTFRPIREEEEALLCEEMDMPAPCQRPTPRYITGAVPTQGNLINLHVIEGVDEGKPEGSIKSEEGKESISLKPSTAFTPQDVSQLPSLSSGEGRDITLQNQIMMHRISNEFPSGSSSTPVKASSHEHHPPHRRRNRHGHSKQLGAGAHMNLLGGQGDVLARTNGRIRGEDDVDDEEDDDEDGDLEEELEGDFLSGPGSGARLSSTSLASSSSSSGGGGAGESGRRRMNAASAPTHPASAPPVELLSTREEAVIREGAVMANSFQPAASSQGRNPSMGAIPKSISFDKTAERGDKDMLEDDHKQKRGFFRNFKLPFKGMQGSKGRARKPGRGNTSSSVDDIGYEGDQLGLDGGHPVERKAESFDSLEHVRLRQPNAIENAPPNNSETMEDILAKYRRKPEAGPSTQQSEGASVSLSSLGVTPTMNGSGRRISPQRPGKGSSELKLMRRKRLENDNEEEVDSDEESGLENEEDPEEDTGYGTGMAEEEEVAFEDAKRKLRLVLSNANILPLEGGSTFHAVREVASSAMTSSSWATTNGGLPGMCVAHRQLRNRLISTSNELVSFLRLQLAEAVSLHDGVHQETTVHIRETLRCVMSFDNQRCCKLFRALREDYRRRAPYLAYLVRCKQGLLSTLAHLERLLERAGREKEACSKALIWICVNLFVKRHEKELTNFVADFGCATAAMDEKVDLLRSFLKGWNNQIEEDPTWQGASEEQVELARIAMETVVMGRVYMYALYPNGDGDISRDQVLHEHMKKLSKVIKPGHKDLRIPKAFRRECPWPSAQTEISTLGNYCTPRDKVACVSRTCTTLITLLAMASERTGSPAADDLIPVLIYVLIKANPPSLLSTVQFVNSFYGSSLVGSDQYWWVQFCSAIEFIKTMDYSD